MAARITIADLFPDEKGMILVAADASDGSMRHISDVDNGTACGCVCFGCKRPLVAKNGGDPLKMAHHFAHRPEDVVTDCVSAGETALHRYAKDIIKKHGRVTVPPTSFEGINGKTIEVTAGRSIELTDIRLETVVGELIPDVAATMPDGRTMFVEIYHTHRCSREKIEKLRGMRVEVLEIAVSAYRDTPFDELDEIVLDMAPRDYLVCAERDDKAAEAAEERLRRDEVERQKSLRLVSIYREPPSARSAKAAELADEMSRWGFENFIDLDETLPSAFIVPRRQWQAAVLYRFVKTDYPATVSPIDLVDRFKQRTWEKPELLYMKTEASRKIAVEHAEDFKSAYVEIMSFIRRLEKAEVVYQKPGKTFYMPHDYKRKLVARLKGLDREDANEEALALTYDALLTFDPICSELLPDFEEWLPNISFQNMATVQAFLDDTRLVDEVVAKLTEIRSIIERRRAGEWEELPDDHLGLPLARTIDRLMKAWAAAAEDAGDGWRSQFE